MGEVPVVGLRYDIVSRIAYTTKEPTWLNTTPNTGNIIQIIVAAIITMVILDLLHVWG